MTYVIALPCVDIMDRACVDECPVDCTYEGGRLPSAASSRHPAGGRAPAAVDGGCDDE